MTKKSKVTTIQSIGIDGWGRVVFKAIDSETYFKTVDPAPDNLCHMSDTECYKYIENCLSHLYDTTEFNGEPGYPVDPATVKLFAPLINPFCKLYFMGRDEWGGYVFQTSHGRWFKTSGYFGRKFPVQGGLPWDQLSYDEKQGVLDNLYISGSFAGNRYGRVEVGMFRPEQVEPRDGLN